MGELEKILEEIEEEIRMKKAVWESLEKPPYNDLEQSLWIAGMRNAKDIICKHLTSKDNGVPTSEIFSVISLAIFLALMLLEGINSSQTSYFSVFAIPFALAALFFWGLSG